MVSLYIPLLLTFLFSITHFFFEEYAHHLRKIDVAFTSFSSGIFIAYIFLTLFPGVLQGSYILQNGIFFIMLWGFVLLHIVEKYVMHHTQEAKQRMERLTHVRTASFFINHVLLGMALIFFFEIDKPAIAVISIIPVFFHIISSSTIVEHLHRHVRETIMGKILSSGAFFFGALFAAMLKIPLSVFFGLFAFITGTLFYIVVRDVMPKHQQGKPVLFLWGVISYLLLLGIGMVLR